MANKRITAAFALLWASCAFANTTPSFDELMEMPLIDLMKITVKSASLGEETLGSAPGSLVVVQRQQILNRGYRHLKDLMQDLPGVDIQSNSSWETEHRFTLRGVVGNSKFIILQDGIRVSPPTGDAIAISFNYPLYNIQQVEVVYGPASALYGADAFTGVINLITQKDPASSHSHWTTEIGENQYRYSSLSYLGQIKENIKVALGADFHQDNHQDLSSEYPDRFPNNDLVTFSGNTIISAQNRDTYQASTQSHTLNLQVQVGPSFQLGYNRRYYQVPTTIIALPDNINYNEKNHWITQLDTLSSQYEYNLTETTSSKTTLSYSFYELNNDSQFNNILTNYINGYKYARGEETQFTQQFHMHFSSYSSLTSGLTFERFNYLPAMPTSATAFDPSSPSTDQQQYYLGSDNSIAIRTFESHYSNHAVFFELKNALDHHWTSTLGIRHDENSIYGESTNPRLGLVWQPNELRALKILYGEAYLAPSPSLIFQHYGGFAFQDNQGVYQSFLMHVPNPDLQPEEMKTLEINLNQQISTNLKATLSLYTQEVTGIIAAQDTPSVQSDFVQGGNIASTVWNANQGDLHSDGLDLSLFYQASLSSSKLNIWGSYSWIDGHLKSQEGKVELPFTAKNKLKMGATYEYSNYFFSPSLHWIDKTSGGETGENIGKTVPAYTLLNVYMGARSIFYSELELGLRIQNVLNKKYENSNVTDEFEFFDKPQPTRSWQASIRLHF
jgi:iron complex outermembrane receptor protein